MRLERAMFKVKMNREIRPEDDYVVTGTGVLLCHNKDRFRLDFEELEDRAENEDASVVCIEAYGPQTHAFPEMDQIGERLADIAAFPELSIHTDAENLQAVRVEEAELVFLADGEPGDLPETDKFQFAVERYRNSHELTCRFTDKLLKTMICFPNDILEDAI